MVKNYTLQTLRDLTNASYEDEAYEVGHMSVTRRNKFFTDQYATLDFVNNDKKAPGLEAIAFVQAKEFGKRFPKKIFVAVKGSENRQKPTELFNDWVRADLGELNGITRPLQSNGLQAFMDTLFAKFSSSRFVITGHSLGGALAAKIFANQPEKFEEAIGFSSANSYLILSDSQKVANDHGLYSNFKNYYNQYDPIHYVPFADNYVGTQEIVEKLQFPDERFDPNRKDVYDMVTKLHSQDFFEFNWDGSLKSHQSTEKTLNFEEFNQRFLKV